MGLGEMNEAQQKNMQTPGSYLDKVNFGNSQRDSNPDLHKNASNLISKVTKDPIMSEIFADTVSTTLQEQRENNRGMAMSAPNVPADAAARVVANSDPTEIFGDSANKWASLAFAPKISR